MNTHCVVVPLGKNYTDDGQDVCPDTKLRIKKALVEVVRLEKIGAYTKVHMACGPGREGSRAEGVTMAELMASEVVWVLEREYCPYNFSCFVNTDDYKVWGTLAEMRWAIKTAQEKLGPQTHFVFVSARRHDARIKCILSWFFPRVSARVVQSDDTPATLGGEVAGYCKLLLAKSGFERPVEWFRRRVARPYRCK